MPSIPEEVFRRLPPEQDGLVQAASEFYGTPSSLLPVPGSQWAIAHLCEVLLSRAQVCPGQRVAVPRWGYKEHAYAWARAGMELVTYDTLDGLFSIIQDQGTEHAIVISPNNPTTECASKIQLRSMAQSLQARGGWLVVDQAFADLRPADAACGLGPNAVCLHSLGKFFGLAGLRLGFVAAHEDVLASLRARLGPWALTHPTRWIATRALQDRSWQKMQRERVQRDGQAWSHWLRDRLGHEVHSAGLFCTLKASASRCEGLFEQLGQRGVLTRIFEPHAGQNLMRFGLPPIQDSSRWEAWFTGIAKEAL